MHLDQLDTAILRALLEDGRRSLRDIAGMVSSTPTTVGARLEKLQSAGVLAGVGARLDPGHMPGRVRLLEGHAPAGREDAVLAKAHSLEGVVHAALTPDGRLVVVLHVDDLDIEDAAVAALSAAGATRLGAVTARRVEGPPPMHLFDGAADVSEACALCAKTITDAGITQSVDGRRVVFCCTSCQRLYQERYDAMKAAAGKP